MKPKIIPLGTMKAADTTRDLSPGTALEDLFRSGHVVVRSADTAGAIWLQATRALPDAYVTLTRTSSGYRVNVSYTPFV